MFNLFIFNELCGFDIVFSYRVHPYNAPRFDYSIQGPKKFDVRPRLWDTYAGRSRQGWDCACGLGIDERSAHNLSPLVQGSGELDGGGIGRRVRQNAGIFAASQRNMQGVGQRFAFGCACVSVCMYV